MVMMADGLNDARGYRIHELAMDYRQILHYIGSITVNPSAEEYNEEGFQVLRACAAHADLLRAQVPAGMPAESNNLTEVQLKVELRRIIADIAVRRFRAQKIYLRAGAALRWIHARAAVLQGQTPHAGHAAMLQQIRLALRAELVAITDQHIAQTLRDTDEREGRWLVDDPTFQRLQQMANNGNGNGW